MIALATMSLVLFLYTAICSYVGLKSVKLQGHSLVSLVDNQGVPFADYDNVNGLHVGIQRNPLVISEKALEYYDHYQHHADVESKTRFLNCVDWLLGHSVRHQDYSILEYEFRWPELYDLIPPWRSAMAQSCALVVMERAHGLTHEKKYEATTQRLLRSFFVEVRAGGVTYKTPTHGWWYEEYAGQANVQEPKVLNGMIYTVLQLHVFNEDTRNSDGKFLFDQGVTSLKENLFKYDGNGHSYYDLHKNYSKKYHRVHIQLLERLYAITHDEIFYQYAQKWKSYHF